MGNRYVDAQGQLKSSEASAAAMDGGAAYGAVMGGNWLGSLNTQAFGVSVAGRTPGKSVYIATVLWFLIPNYPTGVRQRAQVSPPTVPTL